MQYEESPYPYWQQLPSAAIEDFVQSRMTGEGRKVLSAGCGTGREPALFAQLFPAADILAVDLSRASLAYGQRKAQQFGLKNITFKQGDILAMGGLEDRFDVVACGGVLHHMQDPLAGWRTLLSLLKPDGLMRVGLYSRKARRHIIAAQQARKAGSYTATPQGMRDFRHNMDKLLPAQSAQAMWKYSDSYTMPTFRDLVFHVQEHCYNLREISAMLDELGLAFVQFSNLPSHVYNLYGKSFPRDKTMRDLNSWHNFEMANPDTFNAMYQFWCVRKDSLTR
jgi:ubiquinone/menaquinone biosynthesis C-methylase UbiE